MTAPPKPPSKLPPKTSPAAKSEPQPSSAPALKAPPLAPPAQPVARLDPPSWAKDPEIQNLLSVLAAQGEDTRFVGGCVRDHLLGRAIGDFDIGTPLTPDAVIQRLDHAGIDHAATGLEHGTVTALLPRPGRERRPVEVTSLRIDVETFGRHAKVAFTDDWQADAARRDLTFNALSMSPDGALYDYFGGCEDLAAGRLRFIGDARARIREDYLRLLRFFRFQAHYGRVDPDPETLEVIRALAPQLARLSGERIRVELIKLLSAPNPLPVVAILLRDGIFQGLLETRADQALLERLLPFDRSQTVENGPDRDGPDQDRPDQHGPDRDGPDRDALGGPRPILRLAAILAPGSAEAAASRLKLSKRDKRQLGLLLSSEDLFAKGFRRGVRRRLLQAHGAAAYGNLLRLATARGDLTKNELLRHLDERGALAKLDFPLRGRDLRARGIATGPEIGHLLKALEDWWDEEDCRPDRRACLAKLETLSPGSGDSGKGESR